LLAPVLAEFGRRHPLVCVELLTDARFYNLPQREADMVFRIKPFDEPEVVSRRLMHITYALYGPIGAEKPSLGDGEGVRLITMDTAFSDMPEATIAHRSNNREVQARLCAQGCGLAVLPRPLGDTTPNIAAFELDDPPPGRDTFVGYHRDLKRLARMREMLGLIVERLAVERLAN